MDVVQKSLFALPLGSTAIGAGVTATLRDIMGDHLSFVWRTLKRHGVRESDLQDQSQEVFLLVHTKLAEFRGESALRTWIYGIAMRVAAGYRRKAHVTRESVMPTAPEQPMAAAQERAVEEKRALARLQALLEAVEPQKREVFVLYEVEELAMIEVAKAVGCPLRTAYAWYNQVREHVQKNWGAER
jgi:RNA polymerase sigma-70 factor (ECF subfamily)